ncbi:hypothetical protein EGW08_018245 [Elysia chlorotica]|uniref:Peptidase M1 leukotriene A4 hydrolase/aminopeptidase C-terminal domain-containing protein n=1 Tax=Elysia chlorotica TaxID=188477 RepID=A0A3S0Z9U8_ELYCH|nr:hypothetical protein EGW08_018245 [Elysia chlorotica]
MDLLLSSNYNDVQVLHWILDLKCNFSQKQLSGTALLFCQSSCFPPDSDVTPESKACIGSSSLSKSPHIDQGGSDTPAYGKNAIPFILDCDTLDIEACFFHSLPKKSFELDSQCYENLTTDSESMNECRKGNQSRSYQVHEDTINKYFNIFQNLKKGTFKRPVDFVVEKSCLRISIPHTYLQSNQKRELFAVEINYQTCREGPSLTWTQDQNMQPCVYTSGHLLNNRSLMPCQDMPEAMSTWHCYITVCADKAADVQLDKVTVLMAGETEPSVVVDQDGNYTFGYHSSYPMPASTFALAIGTWSEFCSTQTKRDNSVESFKPRVRLFAPSSLDKNPLRSLTDYLPACFSALHSVLGLYPLQRLDILIVPANFDSLGMMGPHLLFLSQSTVMCGGTEAEGSMFYRVAHELCHTWLGVLTGPRDWTEEWLTEGLCCYLEDVVHARALMWSATEARERLELRCLLKYRVLKAEISATSEDLQMLRPNGDTTATDSTDTHDPCIVKNGLNPHNTLLQVHYLKGFFLLRYLEQMSGKEEFLEVLKTFIENKMGKLFSSTDLLEFCFEQLPKLRQSELTLSRICQEWLDSPGMPQTLSEFLVDDENSLFKEVQNELSSLKAGASRKRRKQPGDVMGAASDASSCSSPKVLLPEQRVLLLDLLVEEDARLTRPQMQCLRERLRVQDAAAEVQHSWCELVISRKALAWLGDVERFLTQHQAMGVYLYGELMISENGRFQALAHKVFQRLRPCMAENQRLAVEEMLFPT